MSCVQLDDMIMIDNICMKFCTDTVKKGIVHLLSFEVSCPYSHVKIFKRNKQGLFCLKSLFINDIFIFLNESLS